MPSAFLLSATRLDERELRLVRLLEFYGVEVCSIRSDRLSAAMERMVTASNGEPISLLTSDATLSELLCNEPFKETAVGQLLRHAHYIFVYLSAGQKMDVNVLRCLSGGSLKSADLPLRASANIRMECSFSGLDGLFTGVTQDSGASLSGFVLDAAGTVSKHISVDRTSVLVSLRRDKTRIYFSGCGDFLDIRARIGSRFSLTDEFFELFPLLIFLRQSFGNQIWHAPGLHANLILDDPLLRPRYGFVNFSALDEKLCEINLAATVAFIPWNFKRSDGPTVDLFRKSGDRLSVCVHGSDHTQNEFSETDLGKLNAMSSLALRRMETHEQITAMPFTRAMVFPQGAFSSQALFALKCNNYLAAVNSSLEPRNSDSPIALTIGDFLEPAVMNYYGFPLYHRWYPSSIDECALDLFLGKPALFVEHHEYFRDGFEPLTRLGAAMQTIAPSLTWTSLRNVLLNGYWQRKASPRQLSCRAYANQHLIENRDEYECELVITKKEPDESLVESVSLNGYRFPFQLQDGTIEVRTRIPAGQRMLVEFRYRNALPRHAFRRDVAKPTRVRLRRYLSEFRDNSLARNETLLAFASLIKRALF